MRYCRNKSVRTPYLITTVVFFILSAVIVLTFCASFQHRSDTSPGAGVTLCILSVLLCIGIGFFFLVQLVWQFRKYEISKDGICVAYWKFPENKISWDALSEIGICRVHFSTRGGSETVFRFVVGEEYNGPDKGYGEWTYLRYSMKYHYRIIIIDYSETLHQEIKKLSPIKITDYRHLPDH